MRVLLLLWMLLLSLSAQLRGFSAQLKGFAPSLQQKHPISETSPPSICFPHCLFFARRNADLIGIEGMGRREAASKEGVWPASQMLCWHRFDSSD